MPPPALASSVSLRFAGRTLDFAVIDEATGLAPTELVLGPGREDTWLRSTAVPEGRSLAEHVALLLAELEPRRAAVRRLAKACRGSIWCSYRSELALGQVAFPKALLASVAGLGLDLELSILSWGGVARARRVLARPRRRHSRA